MKLNDRIAAVVSATAEVGSLGKLTSQEITEWIELELGQFLHDPDLQRYGHQHCLALPLSPILHIVSGNTPQAAWQSLLRGVLVGARNWVKMPKEGLLEVETFVKALPEELRPALSTGLEPKWMEEAEIIVVFGSDETVREFSGRILPSQRFLAHGHKISLGLIWGRCDLQLTEGIVRDVFSFDQLGCLSPQFFYVAGDSTEFAYELSKELEKQPQRLTTTVRKLSTAAALRAFREEWKFRAAAESEVGFWDSHGNLDWVVIHDPTTGLVHNPLHGTIIVKPMPLDPKTALFPIRRLISTIGLHPLDLETVALAVRSGAQRVCQIGQMQEPPLTWHHDGWPSLASLVRYVDVEGL
jgi:hypothetical protein